LEVLKKLSMNTVQEGGGAYCGCQKFALVRIGGKHIFYCMTMLINMVAGLTKVTLATMGWEIMKHPPYSPI
jgi:hypothetical protein